VFRVKCDRDVKCIHNHSYKNLNEGTFETHYVDGDNIKMDVKVIISESTGTIYLAEDRGYLLTKYGLYYDADSKSDSITFSVKLITNNELEMVYNEVVVARFEVFYLKLRRRRKDKHKNLQLVLRIEN
jgi:hypothetical protein